MPAAVQTARPAEARPPALAWEYRFDFAALTRTHVGESHESGVRALSVGADGAVVVAMAVRTEAPGAGTPPADAVLLVAKLSADGKLLWAKLFPTVAAAEASLTSDIGSGRIAVFASPSESAAPTPGRAAGRILILRADGSVERDIALRHPGSARINERKRMEPNQFVVAAAPGRGDGLIVFGEYGPGPAAWYLGALDRSGRRLWEHNGWRTNVILTRVSDARLAPGGRVEALIIRNALSEQHPANAVFQTYDAAGRVVATKELERGRFGCYRFADAATIVALFETEIVWMGRDGKRLRALPKSAHDCEFTQGPDGTLAWIDQSSARNEMKVHALAPGGDRASMTLVANGDRAAAALRGGFVAVLSPGADAPKTAPIVIRRYGAS